MSPTEADVETTIPELPQRLVLALAAGMFTANFALDLNDDEMEDKLAKGLADYVNWLDEYAKLDREVTLPAFSHSSEPAAG